MDNDIKFYDFDFKLLYILPTNKYIAVNACVEFAGLGNIEITFFDEELKQIIRDNCNKILVIWKDFQGYITSYMFTETTNKIFGKHLNGLLQRAVIPTILNERENIQKTGNIIKYSVINNVPWLSAENEIETKGKEIIYDTAKYMSAYDVIQEINTKSNSGYLIKADTKNKTFTYYLLENSENSLMLSVSNLNIYEPEITYTNTDMAFGGWYEKKDDDISTWTYISADNTKTGLYKIDVVLSADTEEEAKKELSKHISDYKITAKTKALLHGSDYNIGDIVRVQINGVTEKRLISGVNMWNEQSYGEEPILTEIQEETDNG